MSAEVEPKRTGIETVAWCNITQGWRMWCLCGEFSTSTSPQLAEIAYEMEDHWRDEHGWPT